VNIGGIVLFLFILCTIFDFRTAAAAHGTTTLVAHTSEAMWRFVLPSFAVADENSSEEYKRKGEYKYQD
jgi:hypothetical protein